MVPGIRPVGSAADDQKRAMTPRQRSISAHNSSSAADLPGGRSARRGRSDRARCRVNDL